ncbi:TaqI-like C-terminal specificity domain-containing protein [Phormidium sp. FACHB-1136]|uniref:Eco57I restriction-modification methylase domain-containing protein n=1 Tax=Phormidium sp. FACHB-1136 TaxID=2692848 RepID=UPI001681CE46|nr:TaqI-like C-terminal specificity domain-containing protein [Phormidium sp. FACHB-1136]MBD2425735.1 Eco57I restriction-modification methylase domain-containing protein [Phormidium sp. FACHB-1136]
MDKTSAKTLLTNTLQRPFEEAQFRQFARNLVNDLDESKALNVQGAYIKETYRNQVKQYKRLGQYIDPDGNTIDVLVVRLHRQSSLERARTMQRNFMAQYLQDRGQKEAALVAYTTDESLDWRFSLVRLDYRLEVQADGSYKPTKEVTAARRSSFLVGQTEPNHTAQQQLLPLLLNDRQNPTLDELEAAFNIESVTQEFFGQYKALFLQVRDEVEALIQTDTAISADFSKKHIDPANFAKKLLGQIVFLYFLQKKGWLGVEPGQPWGQGPKDFLRRLFNQETIQYHNFFNDVLEPLFYDALASHRGDESLYELPGCQTPCKIPFLNGGLFEPIGGYDWQTTNVLIANPTIQQVLDTFDLYNFTVREDEPLDKEVAVDPEMLGKVFENLLEVTDRKAKGAFYTPREIVHYMCQESLINYLDTTLNRQAVELMPPPTQQASLFATPTVGQLPLTQEEYCERVPRGDLERLIREGEWAMEHDAQVVQKGNETSTYSFRVPEAVRAHAAEIDQALAAIKICDPAIGSGAFPVGMMQEIVKVRGILSTYLAALTPSPSPWGEGGKKLASSPLSTQEIPSKSPPSPSLGEGGRGDEGRSAYAFKRHAIQNSIYGVDIDPGAVDIAKLRLWLSLVVDEEDYTRIKPLPNLDYKIVCGNSLLGVDHREGTQPYQGSVLNYQPLEQLDRLMIDFFDETNSERKAKLNRDIKALIKTLTGNEDTFDFKIYFSEVFQQQGGFDIVIGNPPYVRQEQIKHLKDQLKPNYESYTGTADLYIFFYERGLNLLRDHGVLTYISSNKWFRAAYGKKLRQLIIQNTQIQRIIDFGDAPVFAAIAYPTIVIIQKSKPPSPEAGHFHALNWDMGQPIHQFETAVQTQTFAMPQTALTAEGWQFADATALNLLAKLRQAGTPLGDYVNNRFYRGILTGFNEAFVVDQATRDRLIAEHPSSAEVLKPFLRGRDVKRWRVDYQNLWIIFTRRGIDIKKYPAIHKHLHQFKDRLTPGNPGGRKPGSYEWYEIQDNIAYWQEFERPKIIYPDIAARCEFTFDTNNLYPDCTLFIIPEDSTYLAGVLNSAIVQFFIDQICPSVRGDFKRFKSIYVSQIPIPPASPEDKARIETLVNYILFLAKELKDIPGHGEAMVASADDKLMLNYFEQIVDATIMELYLPEELHAANKSFMSHLATKNLPTLEQISGDTMESLRSIFRRLFKKDHPIRENLFFLDSVPVVRIIRGLK